MRLLLPVHILVQENTRNIRVSLEFCSFTEWAHVLLRIYAHMYKQML